MPKTPGSLDEALVNLRKDHEFMLQGDVFTQDVIDTWIWYKQENEVDAIRLRPHPYEFSLYYDISRRRVKSWSAVFLGRTSSS